MSRPHPAKFSSPILDCLQDIKFRYGLPERVLDPFGGIGTISRTFSEAVCVEIEPEWATGIVADALYLPFPAASFYAAVTSPTYGTRMADHHNARDGSKRITYKHYLGRDLHPHNSGQLQWGYAYREFHRRVWKEMTRVTTDFFVLNISDHIRKKQVMPVAEWHDIYLRSIGWEQLEKIPVSTQRTRYGQNHQARVEHEMVYVYRRAQ